MTGKLTIVIIIFAILFFLLIVKLINDKKLSVKYSLIWLVPLFIFLLTCLIPNFMQSIANLLGFETLVSFIFSVLFAFLLFICLSLTIIVSKIKNRERVIIQELSLLKSKFCEEKKR